MKGSVFLSVSQYPKPGPRPVDSGAGSPPPPRPNPQTSRPAVPRPARALPRWGCPAAAAAAAAAARRLGRSVPHCPRERRPLTTATRRARPSRPSAAAARPAPRAAVRPERRPLPEGWGDPPPAARPGAGSWGRDGRRDRGVPPPAPAQPRSPGAAPGREPLRSPPDRAALREPPPTPRAPVSVWGPPPGPELPGSGSDPSEPRLRPSARPGSRLCSLLRHPSPRGALPQKDPRPSATHGFREARPLSARDRLPDRLEEGPESGVIPCTPPRHSPKATPRMPFWG
ncbi:translation initiation factor IF-2-like [Lontra canadensis]|uniref:translation initiation factor IF-2-like n=1 Tax=Lontra canadensis TaxID=76717 RepID=UPI0013F36719|nr:translation initiation factor IF-2-like [Lontra canadensis]